jgi:hypothetical protein
MQSIKTKDSTPGIIDLLSAGFDLVNRTAWVLALPVLVNLFLWLGPRFSAAPVANNLLDSYHEMLVSSGGVANDANVAQFTQSADALRDIANQVNLTSFLVNGIAAVPTVSPGNLAGVLGTIEISSLGVALLLVIVFHLAGLFLGCLFLGIIAQRIRDGDTNLTQLKALVPRYWLSVVKFMGIVIGLTIGIGIPLALVIGIAQLIVPALGGILMGLLNIAMFLLIIWMFVYLFFLVDAIVYRNLGPIPAVLSSMRVVSRHFWSALGFIVVVFVVLGGTQIIWAQIVNESIGLLLAIVANAYIVSGVVAAGLMYYRSRSDEMSGDAGVATIDQAR